MLNFFAPVKVRNVNQAVNPFFNSDKDPEISDIAHRPFDDATHRILFFGRLPRIGHDLFETEGDAAMTGVNVENNDFDRLADLKYSGRAGHFLCPGNLCNMNEALDSTFHISQFT